MLRACLFVAVIIVYAVGVAFQAPRSSIVTPAGKRFDCSPKSVPTPRRVEI